MKYRGARIQVLDLPGIIEGAADGRGRGRQVISTARTCNLILIVLDAGKPVTHKKIIEQELFSFGIRINQVPPDVKIVVKTNGGIGYQEVAKQTKGMNPEVARLVCKEYKISCAEIILREDITVDQFIDVIEGKYVLIMSASLQKTPCLVLCHGSLACLFLTTPFFFSTNILAVRTFQSFMFSTRLTALRLKNWTFWINYQITFPLAANMNGIWKN